MSPWISNVSFNAPKRLFGRSSAATSFDTGFPFFVMITDSPVFATSSITRKHFALNSDAFMIRCLTMVMTMVTELQRH